MKDQTKKTPGNSKLKTLPAHTQRALFDAMEVGTIAEALRWLRKDHGIVVSPASASRWYGWYGATRTLREANEASLNYAEWLKEAMPGLSEEELVKNGQKSFLALTIKTGDLKGFAKVAGTIKDRRRADQAEAKIQEASKIMDSGESAESTAEKLKKLFARQ